MSAESSGVFTLKEINRIKIYRTSLNVATTRRAAEHLGITTGNAAVFLPVTEGGPLGMASQTRWHVVTASCHRARRSGSGTDQDAYADLVRLWRVKS
jgi:hypothetical protein